MTQRDARLEASLNTLKNGLRDELVSAVETGLSAATTNMQASMDVTKGELVDTVRASVTQVPPIDGVESY